MASCQEYGMQQKSCPWRLSVLLENPGANNRAQVANNRPNLRSSVAGMKPVLLKNHSYFTKKPVDSILDSLGAVLGSPVWNTYYILLLSALYKSSWILALVSKVHWSGLIDEIHKCCLPDMNRMSRLKSIQRILDWYVVGISLLGKNVVELNF